MPSSSPIAPVLPSASHVVGWYADASKKVGVMKINRPRKKNCLSTQTYNELTEHLLYFENDPDILAVVLTSDGDEYFTSGTDVSEGIAGSAVPSAGAPRTFMGTIVSFSKILIAAVNGHAIGIGVTLLMYCDFVYSVPHATFRTPFMALGIVPEFGSSVTFPALLGKTAANDLLLRSKTFDMDRAVRCGLVSDVVPTAGFLDAVVRIAVDIANQLNAHASLLLFKQQLNKLGPLTKQQVLFAIDSEYEVMDRRVRNGEFAPLGMAYLAQLHADKVAKKSKL
ncbi:Aste57867_24708 [Aphanomyces stellatus]|uniref:Aste57867_24708 protein n=1 Tax=Aphanomyces stellatus TaxID=120398 RepID=A0A485LR54_9STRA|nr:hypothetical protein As57867_024630 [Aphanomyces stellatus]VFU01345.1 Aste57867_24708 [Aphanomyces stellatus]